MLLLTKEFNKIGLYFEKGINAVSPSYGKLLCVHILDTKIRAMHSAVVCMVNRKTSVLITAHSTPLHSKSEPQKALKKCSHFWGDGKKNT